MCRPQSSTLDVTIYNTSTFTDRRRLAGAWAVGHRVKRFIEYHRQKGYTFGWNSPVARVNSFRIRTKLWTLSSAKLPKRVDD